MQVFISFIHPRWLFGISSPNSMIGCPGLIFYLVQVRGTVSKSSSCHSLGVRSSWTPMLRITTSFFFGKNGWECWTWGTWYRGRQRKKKEYPGGWSFDQIYQLRYLDTSKTYCGWMNSTRFGSKLVGCCCKINRWTPGWIAANGTCTPGCRSCNMRTVAAIEVLSPP